LAQPVELARTGFDHRGEVGVAGEQHAVIEAAADGRRPAASS
jgi:hypothetical protein